jgi:NAD(P)-dependent dehydrogenase (short-subunit alcohol dehydrogenase family)
MRIWLVTGASRGLGRELVRQALAEGDAVVATARKPNLDPHENLLSIVHDVTDEARATEVVEAALARFGRIDVLVNNAGAALLGAVEETTMAQARAVFETNVFGLFAVTRAVLPVLRRQRAGHLVALSSMGGFMAGAGFGIYGPASSR